MPPEEVEGAVALGELSLDGSLVPVLGALPAAMAAAEDGRALICPAPCAPEAAWVGAATVIGPASLAEAIAHLQDRAPIEPASPGELRPAPRGRVPARREGPGAGQARAGDRRRGAPSPPDGGPARARASRCWPRACPASCPHERARDAGDLDDPLGRGVDRGGPDRPRAPVHDAAPHRPPPPPSSAAAARAKPGQMSLAHNGVLFLDELPEFPRAVLETLRQPLETGEVVVARANAHVRYPCRFLLVAAANPCRCGHLAEPARSCAKAPACGADYMGRISGPLMDRFDLRVEVPPVSHADLDLPPSGDTSAAVADRVAAARAIQSERLAGQDTMRSNADLAGDALEAHAHPDEEGRALLAAWAERKGLSARGYHRVLRVARTIADLAGAKRVERAHIAEALAYRLTTEMN